MEVLGDYGDTDSEDEQPRNTASPSSGLAVGQPFECFCSYLSIVQLL
jgi:hypothetical protein